MNLRKILSLWNVQFSPYHFEFLKKTILTCSRECWNIQYAYFDLCSKWQSRLFVCQEKPQTPWSNLLVIKVKIKSLTIACRHCWRITERKNCLKESTCKTSYILTFFFIVLQQFWSVWGRDKPVEECLHVQAPHSPFKQKVVKAETWDRV